LWRKEGRLPRIGCFPGQQIGVRPNSWQEATRLKIAQLATIKLRNTLARSAPFEARRTVSPAPNRTSSGLLNGSLILVTFTHTPFTSQSHSQYQSLSFPARIPAPIPTPTSIPFPTQSSIISHRFIPQDVGAVPCAELDRANENNFFCDNTGRARIGSDSLARRD
jgi:hypothetical protein